MEEKTQEVVDIDGELFVIDDTAKEGGSQEAVLTPLKEEDRESVEQHEEDSESALEAVDQQVLVAPKGVGEGRPIRQGYQADGIIRLCKNDRCNLIVPPSKNVGRPRLFCKRSCAMRFHSRIYSKRERAKANGRAYVESGPDGNPLQVQRTKPVSLEQAKARYLTHIQRPAANEIDAVKNRPCPFATEESGWKCPAHAFADFYSAKRLCIVYAVYVDDYKEALAASDYRPYTRQWTTHDGYWYDTEAMSPHFDAKAGYVPAEIAPQKV